MLLLLSDLLSNKHLRILLALGYFDSIPLYGLFKTTHEELEPKLGVLFMLASEDGRLGEDVVITISVLTTLTLQLLPQKIPAKI